MARKLAAALVAATFLTLAPATSAHADPVIDPTPGDPVACVLGGDRPVFFPGPRVVAGIGEQSCDGPRTIKIRVGLQQKKYNWWILPDSWLTVYWSPWTIWSWTNHLEQSAALHCTSKKYTHWRVIIRAKMINENRVTKIGSEWGLSTRYKKPCRVPYIWAGSGW